MPLFCVSPIDYSKSGEVFEREGEGWQNVAGELREGMSRIALSPARRLLMIEGCLLHRQSVQANADHYFLDGL